MQLLHNLGAGAIKLVAAVLALSGSVHVRPVVALVSAAAKTVARSNNSSTGSLSAGTFIS